MAHGKGRISICAGALVLVGVTPQSPLAHGVHSGSSVGPTAQSFAVEAAPKSAAPLATTREPKTRGPQLAHAIMARTRPEQGQAVPQGLEKVEIWYDSAVRENFVTLAVINAAGDRVDKRDVAIDPADQTHVTTSVPALGPGAYTVRYRAVSVDGFLASGSWAFEVQRKSATLTP